MFKRLTVICFLAAAPVPAAAQSVQDQIIAQLTSQGFGDFEVSRTLLGRVRILSKSSSLSREMVFNPSTGEILRDYWEPLSGDRATPLIFNPNNDDRDDNSGRGNTGDDDADDHDNNVDDDNSGSGNADDRSEDDDDRDNEDETDDDGDEGNDDDDDKDEDDDS